jgi:hypothetical protein
MSTSSTCVLFDSAEVDVPGGVGFWQPEKSEVAMLPDTNASDSTNTVWVVFMIRVLSVP